MSWRGLRFPFVFAGLIAILWGAGAIPPNDADPKLAVGAGLALSTIAHRFSQRSIAALNRHAQLIAFAVAIATAAMTGLAYQYCVTRFTFRYPPGSSEAFVAGLRMTRDAEVYARDRPLASASDLVADFGGARWLVWTSGSIYAAQLLLSSLFASFLASLQLALTWAFSSGYGALDTRLPAAPLAVRETETSQAPWDFFLAHASEDEVTATALYELMSETSRVFLDKKSIAAGDDWDAAIMTALSNCRVIVILLSLNYQPAYYLREEIAIAVQIARENQGQRRVVPIFLDGRPRDISAIPYGLRLKQALDARDLGLAGVAKALVDTAELTGPVKPFETRRAPELSQAQSTAAEHGTQSGAAGVALVRRNELFARLKGMLEGQFDEVIFALGLPPSQMSSKSSPQVTRAIEVIQFAESQRTLSELARAIDAAAPSTNTRPHESS